VVFETQVHRVRALLEGWDSLAVVESRKRGDPAAAGAGREVGVGREEVRCPQALDRSQETEELQPGRACRQAGVQRPAEPLLKRILRTLVQVEGDLPGVELDRTRGARRDELVPAAIREEGGAGLLPGVIVRAARRSEVEGRVRAEALAPRFA